MGGILDGHGTSSPVIVGYWDREENVDERYYVEREMQ